MLDKLFSFEKLFEFKAILTGQRLMENLPFHPLTFLAFYNRLQVNLKVSSKLYNLK